MKVSIYVDDMLFEFGNNYKKYLDEYKSKFEVEWLRIIYKFIFSRNDDITFL